MSHTVETYSVAHFIYGQCKVLLKTGLIQSIDNQSPVSFLAMVIGAYGPLILLNRLLLGIHFLIPLLSQYRNSCV
jgi:hypothetical protein